MCVLLDGAHDIMRFMKTRERNNLPKYMVVVPRKRKTLDWRDYVVPTKSKKKTNWSERVDEVVYGLKK